MVVLYQCKIILLISLYFLQRERIILAQKKYYEACIITFSRIFSISSFISESTLYYVGTTIILFRCKTYSEISSMSFLNKKRSTVKPHLSGHSFIGIFTYRDLATSFIGTFCFSSSHHSLYIVT